MLPEVSSEAVSHKQAEDNYWYSENQDSCQDNKSKGIRVSFPLKSLKCCTEDSRHGFQMLGIKQGRTVTEYQISPPIHHAIAMPEMAPAKESRQSRKTFLGLRDRVELRRSNVY